MQNFLEVKNLTKIYHQKSLFGKGRDSVKALNGISFSVKKEECFGIVGESGSGKSSLVKAILRLIDVDSGEVFFDNHSLFEKSEKEMRLLRKKMQIVFQNPYTSLNPRFRVFDCIAEGLKIFYPTMCRKDMVKKVDEMLDCVGLSSEDTKKYPHEFSGGQRQRIAIARALVLEPELLILDEPVSALDLSVQSKILELLKDIKNTHNLTYLFISHDLHVVKYFCDRLMVMEKGNVVEKGKMESVFENPQSDYTKKLLSSIL